MRTSLDTEPIRTRDENREHRRRSLIAGALHAVAWHDLDGATVDVICEHAGVSRGLISHYFDGKEDLLVEACVTCTDRSVEIKQAIADDTSRTAEERLVALATSTFTQPIYNLDDMAAWQAFTNASRSRPRFAKAIEANGRALREIFTPLFAQAAADRGVTVDADGAAFGLTALLDGLWASLATEKDRAEPKDAVTACRRFIHGCLTP